MVSVEDFKAGEGTMAKETKYQKKKVKKVMKEGKAGKLHSGSKKGPIVKKKRQMLAIALSEAGITKKKKKRGKK